jgi:hypothetical protein
MVNYRVSTNTNNSNKATLDKKKDKEAIQTKKNGSVKAFYTQTRVIKNICTFANSMCNRNISS